MTIYLTVDRIADMHDRQIQEYGGSAGIQDQGLLEAAVSRPQSGHYSGIHEEEFALWESLVMNHPFMDGNKRTQ